jgi:hypothetical protein
MRLGSPGPPWYPLGPATVGPLVNRKVVGLGLFVMAIAVAVTAGALYLLEGEGGSGTASTGSGVLVDFTRSGGFTGITQHLLVDADGKAVLTTGEGAEDARTIEFELAPSTLERLERVLPEAVRTLDEEPQSGVGCADCFQYDLIYDDVRYTFFDLPVSRSTSEMLDALDAAICEADPSDGSCS